MELELLNAMNQSLQQCLVTILKIIMTVNFSMTVVGGVVYVAGIARLFLTNASDSSASL